jgi:hypothetical protein
MEIETNQIETEVFDFLFDLNIRAASELINILKEQSDSCHLIFPKKRNENNPSKETKRISEQELRFAMTSLFIPKKNVVEKFAVEVPTEKTYNFNGSGNKRSASTDLAFYCGNVKIINIELKANQPIHSAVKKDIEKLLTENELGAWCHIFENEDAGTVKNILEKINSALRSYPSNKSLYFSFLILKTKTLLSCILEKGCILEINYKDYKGLPSGSHKILNSKSIEWQIDKF